MPHIGMPELFVILALMLLVFGPRKLPEIARGLGQGIQEFKQAMRDTFSVEQSPLSGRVGSPFASAEHSGLASAAADNEQGKAGPPSSSGGATTPGPATLTDSHTG
jgi:sec-independent protein translocase protein TatA